MKDKQNQFYYLARDASGNFRSGEIGARDEEEARLFLAGQGFRVEFVSGRGRCQRSWGRWRSGDLPLFSQQLSLLLRSGVSLFESLQLLRSQSQFVPLRDPIDGILRGLQSGKEFHETLQAYPSFFDENFVALVRVGEEAGCLGEVLEKVADFRSKSLQRKGKILSAVAYPVTVLLIALVVIHLLTTNLFPRFEVIFRESGAGELPFISRFVVQFCRLLAGFLGTVFLISCGLFLIHHFFGLPRSWRFFLSRFCLRLPLFGRLCLQQEYILQASSLALSLAHGMPFLEGLNLSRRTSYNVYFQQFLDQVLDRVRLGMPLSQALDGHPLSNPFLIALIQNGERSGRLVFALESAVVALEEDFDQQLRRQLGILQPILLLLLTLIVGGIALATMMPIFQLMESFNF